MLSTSQIISIAGLIIVIINRNKMLTTNFKIDYNW